MLLLGRELINRLDIVFIPGAGSAVFVCSNPAGLLNILSLDRATDIKRLNTYPCTVTNSQDDNYAVEIQPMIGYADEGLYLTRSDIIALELESTGRSIRTRHGECEIYSSAKLRFPMDHNGGQLKYTFSQVYELPEASNDIAASGIVGVPQLVNHVVLLHKGEVYVIDRRKCAEGAVAALFPTLREFHVKVADATASTDSHEQPYTIAECLADLPVPVRDTKVRVAPRLGLSAF